jgi:flagellin-like protein
MHGKHTGKRHTRRGISHLIAVVLVLAIVIVGVAAVAGMFSGALSSGSNRPNLSFEGTQIYMNAATGAGYAIIQLNNIGTGAIRILSVNLTDTKVPFSITFAAAAAVVWNGASKLSNSTYSETITGDSGVAPVASGATYYLAIPAGQKATIRVSFTSGMTPFFDIGSTYHGLIITATSNVPFQASVTG